MTRDIGSKKLAAILFTDAAGFSGKMQQHEERTLKALYGDLERMERISDSCHGQILKRTGDGLLICFESAADAVSCAILIQRELGGRKPTSPDELILQHRIGIHLGDVYHHKGDVMGDGVNIASRLQEVAEPGGVCISQTVFDVVQGKVSFQAVCLGPRQLKNIQQVLNVYRLILDAAGIGDAVRAATRSSRRILVLASGVLAATTAVIAFLIVKERQTPVPPTPEPVPIATSSNAPLQPATIETLAPKESVEAARLPPIVQEPSIVVSAAVAEVAEPLHDAAPSAPPKAEAPEPPPQKPATQRIEVENLVAPQDNRLNGFHAVQLPNGDRYEGTWQDGKRHGKGILKFADGRRYDGEWLNDSMHGQGMHTFADGRKYEGAMENNQLAGQGTMTMENGDVYKGNWKNGKRHSKGRMNWANGDSYEGFWEDDRATGGIFTRADGERTQSHQDHTEKWVHDVIRSRL